MPREPAAPQSDAPGAAFRVGIGYDSHRFAAGRPLILGGITIDSPVGLIGHSDGDAVCHAVTDAVLAAAGLGDIGEMFPDSDAANKDRDSVGMLEAAMRRISSAGFSVGNVDVTLITELPRIAPQRDRICARLATALGVDSSSVSVKGKTNEGMGWIGRREGLACIAVATVVGKRR